MGNNRCRRVVLAVLTVAALLTGSVPAAFAAPSAGGPPAGAAPAGAPAPLEFAPCGEGLNCATLVVPVDHTDPDGATTELPVLRHRATDPARRLGVLLVNPGGPGAPAGDQVRLLVGAFPEVPATLGPEVLARYDVIGLDPRGTGGPGTVRCLTDAQREEGLDTDYDPDLPGGLDRAAVLAATRELTEGCAARNDAALLSQLATDDVARDMDLLRAALGEQQISYFGVSYGTLLGATYATLFPERVQHMVLDSPVHPTSWQQQPLRALTEQAASGEQVLGAYFAACVEAGPDCPFGAGRPAEAFDALVDRLEATPLVVPATENTPAGRVDGATLAAAARVAVFDRGLWPVLTLGLVSAEDGDGGTLLFLAEALAREPDGSPSGLGEANLAVNCLDKEVPGDIARHDRHAAEAQRAAPRTGFLAGYGLVPCASWPVRTDTRFTGPYTAAGAPTVLVLGTRLDSQTPYPWARAMTDSLQDAVLLTVDGTGHGAHGRNGECVDGAVDTYLLTGRTPPGGTSCVQQPPASAALPDPPS
ncbi:MAG TPA: alpha/beta hydrolase [Pseudonocardiaceae bacterium]|nr:alpha/beta hydrolase [Pseudonocardiaceae bacterium]